MHSCSTYCQLCIKDIRWVPAESLTCIPQQRGMNQERVIVETMLQLGWLRDDNYDMGVEPICSAPRVLRDCRLRVV